MKSLIFVGKIFGMTLTIALTLPAIASGETIVIAEEDCEHEDIDGTIGCPRYSTI